MKAGHVMVGVVVGSVFMLLVFLVVRDGHSAYAAAGARAQDDLAKIVIATGGTSDGINDMLFMVYRRQMDERTREGTRLGPLAPDERMTLAIYRVDTSYNLELVGVRDVTYDHMMIQYPTEEGGTLGRTRRGQSPKVTDVLDRLRGDPERPPR